MSVLKNYARKDIVDIRNYLIDQINTICDKYNIDSWTDRNESDLGMVFVELAAGIADMMNFYIDKQALETYLPTVTQRKNAARILSLINYEMKPPVSAICTVQFTSEQAFDFDLVIPKYTQISYDRDTEDEGSIYYATKEDCQILRGTKTVTVQAIQGIVNNSTLEVYDLYRSRKIEINDEKVAYDSVRLIIDGTEWTRVDDVLTDIDKGQKFSVHETDGNHAYIEFDYSWRNYLPSNSDATVLIQFLETEGANGSISENKINSINDVITYNGYDYTEYLSVTNTTAASGGADRESLETAKENAPLVVSSAELMTTLKDYQNIALKFPGVYKAVAVDWNTDNSKYISVPYVVDLYVVTQDKNTYTVSQDFLNELYNYLLSYKWSSIKLTCRTAEIVNIDIKAKIYTTYEPSSYVKIRLNAEDAIKEFFKKSNQDFGVKLTQGKIEDIIKYSDERIDYCEIQSPSNTVKLETVQFPKLGTIDITVEEA